MDRLTPQQRHKNMAAIHAMDTKPEMIVSICHGGRRLTRYTDVRSKKE